MTHSYSKDLPSHYLPACRCNRDCKIYDGVDENDGWDFNHTAFDLS